LSNSIFGVLVAPYVAGGSDLLVRSPAGALTGTSFDEMMRNFELQREKEFTSHVCADHSKGVR
jgi:hypothetical protein